MNNISGSNLRVLTDEEVNTVSGGISIAVWGVGVALGTAVVTTFSAGVAAGYSLGMEMWGKKAETKCTK